MPTVCVSFDYEEFYPVYILTPHPPAASSDTIDVDIKFMRRYERVMKAFHELQDELERIDPIAKRIKTR